MSNELFLVDKADLKILLLALRACMCVIKGVIVLDYHIVSPQPGVG